MKSIKLAIQKSGRLSGDTLSLLRRSGLDFDSPDGRLLVSCADFPLDLLLVRDDDIPSYVRNAACDIGIVGLNVLREQELAYEDDSVKIVRRLGFGRCRLALAVPDHAPWNGPESLMGKRIATSYPASLTHYLRGHEIHATVIPMSGSVEIAPAMGLADAICDLVSSGATLRSNGLRETDVLYESEAVLVAPQSQETHAEQLLERLARRIDGVMKAQHSRYIMMNAPKSSIAGIRRVAPGLCEPTIMSLAGDSDRVAIHVVARENIFRETLEKLKEAGATDILVLPIEKLME